MKQSLFLVLSICGACFLSACGGGSTTTCGCSKSPFGSRGHFHAHRRDSFQCHGDGDGLLQQSCDQLYRARAVYQQ